MPVIAVPLIAVLLVLSGCTGTRTVDVELSAGSASLATGEKLRVDIGAANQSIGDLWYLVGAPDPAVLADAGQDTDPDCRLPGCGGHLWWTFTAHSPGTTTLVFRYCYRSRPENCQPGPGRGPGNPVALAVTVR